MDGMGLMEALEGSLDGIHQILSELAALADQHGWEEIGLRAADLATNLEHPPETVALIGPEALTQEGRDGLLASGAIRFRLLDLNDEALGQDGLPGIHLVEGCRVALVLRAGRLISPELFNLIKLLKTSRPPGLVLLAFTGANELEGADRERAELAARRLLEPDRPSAPSSSQTGSEGPRFLESTAELSTWLLAQPDDGSSAQMRRLQVAALVEESWQAALQTTAPPPEVALTGDSSIVMRRLKEDYRLLSRQIATSHETLLLDLPKTAESGTAPLRRRLEVWARDMAELASRWWSRSLEELRAENLMPDDEAHSPDFSLATPSFPAQAKNRDDQASRQSLLGPAAAGAALGGGAVLSGAILLGKIIPLPVALTASAATSAGLVGGALASSIESRRRQRQSAIQQRAQQAFTLAQEARAELEGRIADAERVLGTLLRRASRVASSPPRGPTATQVQDAPRQLEQLRNRLFANGQARPEGTPTC